MFTFVVFFVFAVVGGVDVKLNGGRIRGSVVNWNGANVNVFKGIPFAEPPVGRLRFRPAVSKSSWAPEVLNTSTYSPACMSNTTQTTSPQENVSEDCLYANKHSCPIIFYIHGGGFFFDSAVMFNDTEIIMKYASHRLVFVIPAFRLGLFGTLDLGRELHDAPYNIGLKDIIFALRWLRREARSFGGDPDQITAYGNSGGASALSALLASGELKKGELARAFVGSGPALFGPHLNQEMTNAVAERLGCSLQLGIHRRLRCLRRKSAYDISSAARDTELTAWSRVGMQEDNRVLNKPSFLDLSSSWNGLPLVISTTAQEMRFQAHDVHEYCYTYTWLFGYKTQQALDACLRRYEDAAVYDEAFSRETQHAFAFFVGRLNALRGAPTYSMIFGQQGHTKHSSDLIFFFGLHPVEMDADDRRMNDFYPAMCRRFFRGEKPIQDWLEVDYNGRNFYYLNISGDERPQMHRGKLFDAEAVRFWLYHLKAVDENGTTPMEPYATVAINSTYNGSTPLNLMAQSEGFAEVEEASADLPSFWAVFAVMVIVTFVLAVAAFTISVLQLLWSWRGRRPHGNEYEHIQLLPRSNSQSQKYVF